ncbi:sulfotransferase [Lentimonas sp. CC10]|uniref:sulfotransferase family protein n=1 Tax=Lentimonas sp. CC10 TaxID=2676095 RepID=UPI00138A6539|nr:sulfotransferase [Lentimonas sp. CC10]
MFVVGPPRSGTTLMHTYLKSAVGFWGGDEESGFFSSVDHFDLKAPIMGISRPTQIELMRGKRSLYHYFDALVGALKVELGGEGRFVEKTPQHAMYLNKILRHFPNAQVVCMMRDPRDCFCSAKGNEHIPQRHSVDEYIKYWLECTKSIYECQKRPNVLVVKYEDLVNDPSVSFKKVGMFLGNVNLDPTDLYVSASKDSRSDKQEFSLLKSPVTSVSVARWQRDLSSADQEIILRRASKYMKCFSYLEQ